MFRRIYEFLRAKLWVRALPAEAVEMPKKGMEKMEMKRREEAER